MNSAQSIAVFVVDDTPSMRDRLRELLDDIEDVEVVGDAGSVDDATAGILRTHPDCVLLDYQIQGGTGVDVLRAVRPQLPQIEFIVLTISIGVRAWMQARVSFSTRVPSSDPSGLRSPRSIRAACSRNRADPPHDRETNHVRCHRR